jgi:hypothetical protein
MGCGPSKAQEPQPCVRLVPPWFDGVQVCDGMQASARGSAGIHGHTEVPEVPEVSRVLVWSKEHPCH